MGNVLHAIFYDIHGPHSNRSCTWQVTRELRHPCECCRNAATWQRGRWQHGSTVHTYYPCFWGDAAVSKPTVGTGIVEQQVKFPPATPASHMSTSSNLRYSTSHPVPYQSAWEDSRSQSGCLGSCHPSG